MSKTRMFVHRIPVQICGLALASASLDMILFRWYGHSYGIFALISVSLLILFTLRALTDREGIRNDLSSPAVLGIVPTYGMAVMVLSARFYEYAGNLSLAMWIAAVVLNILLLLIFTKKFVLGFEMKNVFPAWFVVFVGLTVATVSSPAVGMIAVGKVLLWFDLLCYVMLLPLILYRIIAIPIPKMMIPGIAIFAAPANLCVTGYFSVYNETIPELVAVLAAFGIVSYVAVMVLMPKILRTDFNPGLSAITFPLVISATSFHVLADHYNISSNVFADSVLITVTLIAFMAVCYVIVRYMMFFRGIKI